MSNKQKKATQYYARDEAAVALEFAVILSLLLAFFWGTVEVLQAVDANRRLDRVVTTIGDAIAQIDGEDITSADIEDIFNIRKIIFSAYGNISPDVTVVAVQKKMPISPNIVVWSKRVANDNISRAYETGSEFIEEIPLGVLDSTNNDNVFFLVKASLHYKPVVKWILANGIMLEKNYYFNSRSGAAAICNNC